MTGKQIFYLILAIIIVLLISSGVGAILGVPLTVLGYACTRGMRDSK